MTDRQKQWLLRILLGGGAGVLPALALWGPLFAGWYSAPPVCRGLMDVLGLPGAAAVTLGLCFGFGAAVGGPCGFPGRTQKRPSRTKLPRTGVQTLAAPPCFTARRGRALCGIPTYPRQLTYASRREILGRSRSSRPP